MDIVLRNFFRLLRAGAFGQQDRVEPMSAWKWQQVYELSLAHGVGAEAFEGVEVLSDQFFVQLPSQLHARWAESALALRRQPMPGRAELSKRLARKLADIRESETYSTLALERRPQTEVREYQLLDEMVRLAYALLTANYWVRQLLVVGELVREYGAQVDRDVLGEWLQRLDLGHMAQLEGVMLWSLMGIQPHELPMTLNKDSASLLRSAESIVKAPLSVQSASPRVPFRALRFLRYYPFESAVCFLGGIADSLSNIEE